jgi:phosphoserine phosphatase RsbU/P
MKVLVVDDDPVSRLLLATILRRLGHETTLAEHGRQGWALFESEGPAVVIMDWMMPYVDGLELSRMIREAHRPQYPYLILLTVLGGKGAYLEGMKAGVDDFITKPFDPDELAARLHVAERILGLRAHVEHLEGLLPICMYCKKVEDEGRIWRAVDEYVALRTDGSVSHAICPDCYRKEVEPKLEELERGGGPG